MILNKSKKRNLFKNNKFNYDLSNPETLDKTRPDNYQPGEVEPIRKMLLKRETGSLNFDNVQTPFYEEQAIFSTKSLNQIQNMDLTEKVEFLNDVTKEATLLKNKIQTYSKKLEEVKKANVVTKSDDDKV